VIPDTLRLDKYSLRLVAQVENTFGEEEEFSFPPRLPVKKTIHFSDLKLSIWRQGESPPARLRSNI